MSDFDIALQAHKQARENLVAAAKEELGATIAGIFAQGGVRDVAWGQKFSEYNDEGLYPGIMGPAANQFTDENGNVDISDWWESLDAAADPSLSILRTLLNKIGPEILSEIVGDDENVVVAYDDHGTIRFFSEYAGY